MTIKIGAIILSRMDSIRLPGKALRLVRNKPLIKYVIDRACQVEGVSGICVATSGREIDDPIVKFCTENNICVYRGSPNDVAGRFLECMESNAWDAALRINGDSPLHSYELLSDAVRIHSLADADLITNVFPRSYPIGMSVELIAKTALRSAHGNMEKNSNFEHITEYFYENQDDFNIKTFLLNRFDHSEVHLAVDTKRDLHRFEWIVNELGDQYAVADYEKIIDLYMAYEKYNKK